MILDDALLKHIYLKQKKEYKTGHSNITCKCVVPRGLAYNKCGEAMAMDKDIAICHGDDAHLRKTTINTNLIHIIRPL